MEPDEIRRIIERCPYDFTKEDVPNPEMEIKIYSLIYKTPAMLWIERWKSELLRV